MIVGPARSERVGHGVRRTTPLSGLGELAITVPDGFAPAEDDATAPTVLALLLAMRLGEDLEVRGTVDGDLLARLGDVQDLYRQFDPALRRVRVDAEPGERGTRAGPSAVCMSRGADSLYAASRGRSASGPIERALFVDGLEVNHGPATREREIERAGEAAAALGLELIVARAEIQHLTHPVFDWDDAVGAGLAFVAHSLAGGLGRLVIPSSDPVLALGPSGTGPVLDPLLSSSRVQVEHASVAHTRFGKVRALAEERPDLLALLKVCFHLDGEGNCGRCGKCLHTMICLRLLGALEAAALFPDELDLGLVAAQRFGPLQVRLEMTELRDAAVAAGDGDLAAAIEAARAASAGAPRSAKPPPTFRARHARTLARALDPPAPPLVRALDLRARRHAYGTAPPGVPTAVLGRLALEPGEPLWVLADGRVATRSYLPGSAAGGHARHVLRACRRPAVAVRRALDALLPAPAAAELPACAPAGYLVEHGTPLWSGVHPVTGDQLLTTSERELVEAGYAGATLLGHLDGAPVVLATPVVPWAGRQGLAIGQRTS